MSLSAWNGLPETEAMEALLDCCRSNDWAAGLVERRPYASFHLLLRDAETLWFRLPEDEWLRAFAAHPRIGERTADAPAGPQFAAWSGTEQSSAQATLAAVSQALAAGNAAYEAKFGFIYIVFASGRTAPELLAILEERLTHDRATELNEAARQQWEIAKLRMTRYFAR